MSHDSPPRILDLRPLQVLAGVGIVAVVLVFVVPTGPWVGWQGFDAEVYTIGAKALLDGEPLYEFLHEGYPFTYPPAAAVLFAPLGLLSLAVAGKVMLAVGVVAFVGAVRVLLEGLYPGLPGHFGRSLVVAGPLLLLYPVITSYVSGQVDSLLILLVLADLLLLRRGRGVLVGVAAAIKLTPAVFVLYFLARRDYRAALTSAATALVVTGLAWVALPDDSRFFWFDAVGDPSRVGTQTAALNQSLAGVAARALEPLGPTLTGGARVGWVVACVLVVALGYLVASRLCALDRSVPAVCVVALTGLLVSPISWLHHWAWAAIVLVVLLDEWWRGRGARFLVLAALGLPAMLTAPHWIFGSFIVFGTDPSWDPVAQVLGAWLVWWALGVVVVWGLSVHTGAHPTSATTTSSGTPVRPG